MFKLVGMKPIRVLTATEQVAAHLRDEILRGTWVKIMPGTATLAKKLGVGLRTVSDALYELEHAGLLENLGPRRKRRIVLTENTAQREMRVLILLYEKADRQAGPYAELLLRLQKAGHQVNFCDKTMTDLGMNVDRVRDFVGTVSADAWIVAAAPLDILEFFVQQAVPVFAITGHPVAGKMACAATTKKDIIPQIVRRLIELGHRRIVYLSRLERHIPHHEAGEQAFLAEMKANGIATSSYNLPDWPNDSDGLHNCLDSLFGITPPTALFLEEYPILFAVQQYLGQRGISAPRDISLVCGDYDKGMAWCRPSIAHITWDARRLQQCIVTWTNKLARGSHEKGFHPIKATFIEGGTIGPAPGAR